MSKRWDSNTKIELMKLYAAGRSYEEIGKELDRSPNAIKLRLEAIVYDNLIKDKPVNLLTRMLNTDSDTIKQLYYSHKSFRQGRGEEVKDVVFPPENQINSINQTNKTSIPTDNIYNGGGDDRYRDNDSDSNQKHRVVGNINKNKEEDKISSDIEKIKAENHILEEIIKNYRMKRQVHKLYANAKLDSKSTAMYEQLLKHTK